MYTYIHVFVCVYVCVSGDTVHFMTDSDCDLNIADLYCDIT